MINGWQISALSILGSTTFATPTVQVSGTPIPGAAFTGNVNGYGGSKVGVGVGGGSFGGHSHVGGGIGVDISPTPKYGSGIAIFVEGVPSGAAPPGSPASDPVPPRPQD